MQRIYAVILAIATSISLYGKRTQKAHIERFPRVTITNQQQAPVDVHVVTYKQDSTDARDMYARRSTSVSPDVEHDVMMQADVHPIAVVLQGDALKQKPSVKMRGSWRMRQPRLLRKQHTGHVDMQTVPDYLQELIRDIGNNQLALLEFNTDWLTAHPKATISIDITSEGNVRITS